MADSTPTPDSSTPKQTETEALGWAEFLTEHPPDKERKVVGMASHMNPRGVNFVLTTPELDLLCESEKCGGIRGFLAENSSGQFSYNAWNHTYLYYRCRNCGRTGRVYAVAIRWQFTPTPKKAGYPVSGRSYEPPPQVDFMLARKFGEWPPLGPILPKKLLNLIQSDKELFNQGRRAEGQGMGIGAFGYYRRVVENQRTRIFDKLIEAAGRLKLDAATVEALKVDRDNWQFSQSVDGLKAALPDALKIGGHNPLALLHKALSHNLHSESDEVCLQAAQDIRQVLTGFAERLENVLRDETELEKAVGRLTRQ